MRPNSATFMRRLGYPRPGGAALVCAAILALACVASAAEPEIRWRWSGVDRVIAIGDVHGARDALVEALRESGVISTTEKWSAGRAHLVLMGDLVNRGPDSRGVVELVMQLQADAAAAGGYVHVVLGNHEVMNLVSDLRYVSKESYAGFASEEKSRDRKTAYKAAQRRIGRGDTEAFRARFEEHYPPGFFAYRKEFSSEGRYGEWLLEQPIVVVINDVAFVHGGLSPSLLAVSPDEINQRALQELDAFLDGRKDLTRLGVIREETSFTELLTMVRDVSQRMEAGQRFTPHVENAVREIEEALNGLVFDPEGPLWYRGTSLDTGPEAERIVGQVLRHLGAERAVVGHTPTLTGRVVSRFDGRVVRLDTGMLSSHYGGRASALIIEGGELSVVYPGEERVAVVAQPETMSISDFASVEEIEGFLSNASVVLAEPIGGGSTRPLRLTLEANGRRCRATYKTNDADMTCTFEGVERPCKDSYLHEVAAYRLDRMLGVDMVPPTVIRELRGTRGSLQLHIEGSINESNRVMEDLQPTDAGLWADQMAKIRLFDRFILNPGRDQANILVTTADWSVFLVEQGRAFAPLQSTSLDDLPSLGEVASGFAAALTAVSAERLRSELGDVLSEEQLGALVTRRSRILETLGRSPGQ